MDETHSSSASRPSYIWPWFVAVAVTLAVVIAALAVKREAERVKARKELLQKYSGTNAVAEPGK